MASPATTLLWLSARASETLIEGSKVEVVLGAPGVFITAEFQAMSFTEYITFH